MEWSGIFVSGNENHTIITECQFIRQSQAVINSERSLLAKIQHLVILRPDHMPLIKVACSSILANLHHNTYFVFVGCCNTFVDPLGLLGECGGSAHSSGRTNDNAQDLNRDFPTWDDIEKGPKDEFVCRPRVASRCLENRKHILVHTTASSIMHLLYTFVCSNEQQQQHARVRDLSQNGATFFAIRDTHEALPT